MNSTKTMAQAIHEHHGRGQYYHVCSVCEAHGASIEPLDDPKGISEVYTFRDGSRLLVRTSHIYAETRILESAKRGKVRAKVSRKVERLLTSCEGSHLDATAVHS